MSLVQDKPVMPIAAGRFLRHLRLQFQLLLAPVFLLGYGLSGATPDLAFLGLFLLIHIGLYGGATAYNSYYDRDQGPIGGMKHPLPVGSVELYGGVGLQLLALIGLMGWGLSMFLAGLAMFLLGIAYSHPRWRLKARPVFSLVMVTFGQGLVPFFMGLSAADGGLGEAGFAPAALTACAATLMITGIYPLTQVYQIDEDRARGDQSFAVSYGPQGVFRFSRILVGVGMGLMAWLFFSGAIFHRFWMWLLPVGYLAFLVILRVWARRFPRQTVYQNHDWSFGVSLGMSCIFWGFLCVEFIL